VDCVGDLSKNVQSPFPLSVDNKRSFRRREPLLDSNEQRENEDECLIDVVQLANQCNQRRDDMSANRVLWVLYVTLIVGTMLAISSGQAGDKCAYCDTALVRCYDKCDRSFGDLPLLRDGCYAGCSIAYRSCCDRIRSE
jgi:hypothetical protein